MSILNLSTRTGGLPEYTWANRPTKPQTMDYIVITDIGPSKEIFFYTGSRWIPLNGNIVLAQTNTRIDLTGVTGLVEMASVAVKGGMMSANGMLEIYTLWGYTNSANSKTLGIRLGGSGGTAFFARSETTSAVHHAMTIIRNANSVSSQVGVGSALAGGLGSTSGTLITSSVNTANDTTVSITGNLASAAETITLYGYKVLYRE